MPSLEAQIKQRYRCAKCSHAQASTSRFSATGTGISRWLDWQHQEYLSVSCLQCGHTELYDPRVLGKDEHQVIKILDLIFND